MLWLLIGLVAFTAPFAVVVVNRFAWKIAAVASVWGAGAVVLLTWHAELGVRVGLTVGAVLAACSYGLAWERLFGSPYENLDRVRSVSGAVRRSVEDSVYLTAPMSALIWIGTVLTFVVLGHFLYAAAMVGVTGVIVLIVRALTREPPHRRRRRVQRQS
jgi:hypothetical protein